MASNYEYHNTETIIDIHMLHPEILSKLKVCLIELFSKQYGQNIQSNIFHLLLHIVTLTFNLVCFISFHHQSSTTILNLCIFKNMVLLQEYRSYLSCFGE